MIQGTDILCDRCKRKMKPSTMVLIKSAEAGEDTHDFCGMQCLRDWVLDWLKRGKKIRESD